MEHQAHAVNEYPFAEALLRWRRPILLALFAGVFWQFAFEPKYAADFFAQADYLDAFNQLSPNFLDSLRGNWLVLDVLATVLQSVAGIDVETALKALYFGVFLVKYAVLLYFAKYTRYVVILFLWSFSSQDLNQLRLNIALAILPFLFLPTKTLLGRTAKVVGTLGMIASHLSSVFVLPLPAINWLRGRWKLALVMAAGVTALVAVAAFSFDLTLDRRFMEYMESSERWMPKSLLAAPFMFFAVFIAFDKPTQWVILALAVASICVSLVGLQLVSQRMIEMAFSALLIKVIMDRVNMPLVRDALLFAPAIAIFVYRAIYGVAEAGRYS